MALYEVARVDTVKPGEFDNALVIARGAAKARAAVAHLLPEGAEVMALPVDTNGAHQSVRLLFTYFDERHPLAEVPAGQLTFPDAE
jgi:hypothetical protein